MKKNAKVERRINKSIVIKKDAWKWQADHIIRKSSINLVVFGFAVCTRN